MRQRTIYVCSDSTGETAEAVAHSTIRQFDASQIAVRRTGQITTDDEIRRIVEEAAASGGFIVYTLVQPELREMMRAEAVRLGVLTVDIMGPMMQAFVDAFHDAPKGRPGLPHELDEDYFRRIEAIEFAVKCDDGRSPRGLLQADVVLIGTSRTSKTPVGVFLAHRGFRVANLPLVPEVRPPDELYQVPKGRIVGLTMEAEHMTRIRTERLKALGLLQGAQYASLARIQEEMEYANELMRKLDCYIIDITAKAVEETASLVMTYLSEMTSM